jgi:16S rRNA (uracil1498-N3)-methyltransferase
MFPRFYYAEALRTGCTIELPINTRHHATRVLRLKKGNIVTLFNGRGGEFLAQIEHISKTRTTVIIDKYCEIERESPLTIELAQALCTSEKMDWIIQKSVELGTSCIQPVTTKRSVVRLSPERAIKRHLHWQQIIIAACEQCGRNRIPEILPPQSLSDWFNHKKNTNTLKQHFIMLSTTATESLKDFPSLSPTGKITLLVGPEGGFTPEEEATARFAGFSSLRLGKRILRTESAALATIAAMQTRWGDY